jgi:hypothetical protein
MRFVGVNELPNAFEVGDIIAILDEYTLYPQDYVEELLVYSGICYVSEEAVTRRVAVDIVENAMYRALGVLA